MDRATGRLRANPLIAVVDDDEEVRRALGRLLRSAGFAVLPFETAEQFLANDPGDTDCLVADVCLPGMSGTDLEDHLARSAPRLPVVLITALDDAGTTERLEAVPGYHRAAETVCRSRVVRRHRARPGLAPSHFQPKRTARELNSVSPPTG